MVSDERAAALRDKCLNLAKTCRSGSGPASERTSQSRQLMSARELLATQPTGIELATCLHQQSLRHDDELAGIDSDTRMKQAEAILARLYPIEQAIMQTRARTIAGLGVNSCGYDIVKQFQTNGEPIRGNRIINPAEAEVVRRIFHDYVVGKSAKRIAAELNKDGISAPSGGDWGFSTINGNAKRGNGILNNEMNVGRIVWNRQRFIKAPETGKRQARPNPAAEWFKKCPNCALSAMNSGTPQRRDKSP
jgi:hypothetical protein